MFRLLWVAGTASALALFVAVAVTGCGRATQPAPSLQSSAGPTTAPAMLDEAAVADPYETHAKLYANNRFPSATQCGQCHPTQYRQWSISQHSYAQVSPIFNAMREQMDKGVNGTLGDFCIRCHTQPGMNLGEGEFTSNIDRHPISREGVTCIVCHRLDEPMGKVSGRLPLEEGEITDPIYGPTGRNGELKKAIDKEALVTEPDKLGRKVHGGAKKFFRISTSAFCGQCHDVTLFNGFRLEEAFSEYKHGPAAARGIQCQDCHMGKEPGRVLAEKTDPNFVRINYAYGPAAKVGDFETAPRKLTNHKFVGPDYSVLPPSLFPLHLGAIKEESEKDNPRARGLATIREWMQFDWKAGWGTDAFEKNVPMGYKFPARWANADDRYDARMIVNDNLALLNEVSQDRLTLLRNGYKLGQIVPRKIGPDGIELAVQVKNGTDGHGVPTGFDAERLVWVHVAIKDGTGKTIHESGDLDPDGDVRDLRSSYVRSHQLPLDEELLLLQADVVVRLLRGGEREQILTTNYSPSPLPFLRPERMSSILLGRPSGARKQKHNIEPRGERWSTYTVPKEAMTGHGPYTALVQLKAAMVPVNLVKEVQAVGFDYGMKTPEVIQNLRAGHQVVWERYLVLGQ